MKLWGWPLRGDTGEMTEGQWCERGEVMMSCKSRDVGSLVPGCASRRDEGGVGRNGRRLSSAQFMLWWDTHRESSARLTESITWDD